MTEEMEHRRPEYVPPLNFALVEDGIYRSGFPMPINYPILERLKLKTILYLGDLGVERKKKDKLKKDKHGTEEVFENYKAWIATTDIKFHYLELESAQEPFILQKMHDQVHDTMVEALQLILDKNNFPMLIHSNKGKHRIGVLVGLMRKVLQGWCMGGIFEEYEKFAMGKSEIDLEFIEMWLPHLVYDEACLPAFVRLTR